jgi:hypothetical protein
MQVPDGEQVWRSAVFPIAFKKKKLSQRALFKLYSAEASPFLVEMSLVREKYAPSLEMMHGFGCRLAAAQNRNRVADGKAADRIYCGAYQLRCEDIRRLSEEPQLPEVRNAQVLHIVENDELAHANMQIEVDTGGDEEAIEPVKTLIVDRLWSKSSGPAKHICASDTQVQDHPSEALEDGPNGPYAQRSNAWVRVEVLLCILVRHPTLRAWLRADAAIKWLKTAWRNARSLP